MSLLFGKKTRKKKQPGHIVQHTLSSPVLSITLSAESVVEKNERDCRKKSVIENSSISSSAEICEIRKSSKKEYFPPFSSESTQASAKAFICSVKDEDEYRFEKFRKLCEKKSFSGKHSTGGSSLGLLQSNNSAFNAGDRSKSRAVGGGASTKNGGVVDLSKLRKLSWQGISSQYRALSWQLLLGYVPPQRTRRKMTWKRRRGDYWTRFVPKYFETPAGRRSAHEQETLRQVLVDVPRTCPDLPLFAQAPVRRLLERVLYIWALRHPASGYVQGINDLLTPFVLVFLDHHLCMLRRAEASAVLTGRSDTARAPPPSSQRETELRDDESEVGVGKGGRRVAATADDDAVGTSRAKEDGATTKSETVARAREIVLSTLSMEASLVDGYGASADVEIPYDRTSARRPHHLAFTCDLGSLDPRILKAVEADAYWCLEKLLNGVQTLYTPQQPGIQRMLYQLKGVVQRDNLSLHKHLEKHGVMYEQFAFRWMNCALLRELSLSLATRLFDTYIAEGFESFASFHVFVCAALLGRWSDALQKMNFQDMLTFLQALPTQSWTHKDIDELLAKAYMLKCLYGSAPSHLH